MRIKNRPLHNLMEQCLYQWCCHAGAAAGKQSSMTSCLSWCPPALAQPRWCTRAKWGRAERRRGQRTTCWNTPIREGALWLIGCLTSPRALSTDIKITLTRSKRGGEPPRGCSGRGLGGLFKGFREVNKRGAIRRQRWFLIRRRHFLQPLATV